MRVLNLVTSRSSFFSQQERSVEQVGIRTETITVPGPPRNRKLRHYARFYANVLASNPFEYDLVHANYGLTAPFGLAQPKRPVVLTLWGSDLMGSFRSLSEKCARMYDEVIVRSSEMNDILGGDAHVIPAGVDFELFKPIPQNDALEELGWKRDEKHVLFPYSPDRAVKNHDLAKDVVATANERIDRPVNLQVVTGVPHDRIPIYLNAADVLILTSDREGSPNTIKEALACNTPIVSTDVGDVRARLDGVTNAEVCQDKSELVAALVSIISASERSNGRETIQDIRLERTAERIADVYRQAMR